LKSECPDKTAYRCTDLLMPKSKEEALLQRSGFVAYAVGIRFGRFGTE